MPVRILFITSQYFYPFTVEALNHMDPPCQYEVMSYVDFGHLTQVYQEHIDRFDACFVSGMCAKYAIELTVPNITKPLVAFQVPPDSLYRDLLALALSKEGADFNRIVIDFLFPQGKGCTVYDYLSINDNAKFLEQTQDWMRQHGISGPNGVENYILDQITQLWNQKAIDLVICQYSSLVPAFEKLGIPCHCPFLSESTLKYLIEQVMLKIELTRFHDSSPAVIQIFPRHQSSITPEQLAQLRQQVKSFVKTNLVSCTQEDADNCCILLTTTGVLRVITDSFRTCLFSAFLEAQLDFPVAVGYGIGTTPLHAMNNAQIASREAKLAGKSYVVDSNGSLIGPLNSQARMVLSLNSRTDISDLAARCSLSAMTIQKLMNIVRMNGSDKITIPELAQQMDTTVRNANRIMLSLTNGGVATQVYTQARHSRGRPIQVYRLDFSAQQPNV